MRSRRNSQDAGVQAGRLGAAASKVHAVHNSLFCDNARRPKLPSVIPLLARSSCANPSVDYQQSSSVSSPIPILNTTQRLHRRR